MIAGCDAASTNAPPSIQMDLVLPPSPQVGTSPIFLELTDKQGKPVEGAKVVIEGNMNHAGMKPSFATMQEEEPGKHAGELEFTMGGDWFVLVTVTTAEGETAERKFVVPGVEAK